MIDPRFARKLVSIKTEYDGMALSKLAIPTASSEEVSFDLSLSA